MEKVIFWGTGSDCKNILEKYPEILENIVAFVDNDHEKCGYWYSKPVIAPNEIHKYSYDKVVISSSKYAIPICIQCLTEMKIAPDKILDLRRFIQEQIYWSKIMPRRIVLDVCTLCQLNCVTCPLRVYNYGTVKPGYIRAAKFKQLLDNNEFIKGIEIANNGEAFLNPEIKEILECAYERQVDITVYNGTNFNTVSEEVLDAIVRTKVKGMTISLDGASQETYSIYRRNGNFETVINNIRKINNYKIKYKSEFPKMIWQFVLMSHNEHEITKAKKLASELNMGMKFKLTWDKDYIPKNPEYIRRETGLKYLSREDVKEKTGKNYMNLCRQLWEFLVINWDGRLLGCCNVYNKDFGVNVFDMGLKEALNSTEYVNAKKMLLGIGRLSENKLGEGETATTCNPCTECMSLEYMIKKGTFLNIDDIQI